MWNFRLIPALALCLSIKFFNSCYIQTKLLTGYLSIMAFFQLTSGSHVMGKISKLVLKGLRASLFTSFKWEHWINMIKQQRHVVFNLHKVLIKTENIHWPICMCPVNNIIVNYSDLIISRILKLLTFVYFLSALVVNFSQTLATSMITIIIKHLCRLHIILENYVSIA